MTAKGASRIVSSFEATGLDERGWNALAGLGTNTIFQTYQWHRSWWNTYGSRLEPLFVTVSDGRNTIGVAPFCAEETAAGNRVVRFVGEGRADYCDLLAGGSAETVAAIIRGLNDYPDWDLLDLGGIPSESATVPALKAQCEAAGLRVMVHDESICPSLVLRGHEPAARRMIDKPSLRRRQRNLERCGRLEFRDLSSAADIDPYLDQFFEQHTARWRMTSAPSLFHDTTNRTFYRELMSRLDGTGWLLFTAVQFEDRPIAFHYGFDYNDVLLYYKPSFDPALAARSPGLVLVRHLIARALQDGRRELDFTIGDEPFKQRFTNTSRKTVNVQIFRNPALYLFERSRRGVLSAVRRAVTKVRAH
jgi:CelD/BcsL family acetyltransferase involved in cellulose biosynthesis